MRYESCNAYVRYRIEIEQDPPFVAAELTILKGERPVYQEGRIFDGGELDDIVRDFFDDPPRINGFQMFLESDLRYSFECV